MVYGESTSTVNVPPTVRLPDIVVPGLNPGESVPPASMVSGPSISPDPDSTSPLPTETPFAATMVPSNTAPGKPNAPGATKLPRTVCVPRGDTSLSNNVITFALVLMMPVLEKPSSESASPMVRFPAVADIVPSFAANSPTTEPSPDSTSPDDIVNPCGPVPSEPSKVSPVRVVVPNSITSELTKTRV